MKLSQLSLADYNQLDSIPVINQDLTVSGFTPVANTYYRHTGATTDTFTKGVIYYYNSTGYVALDGSAVGLATVAKTGSYNDLQNIPTDIAKIGNLSNPNLLINPNFAINQRGKSEYNQTGYTVDRWTLDAGGTLTLQNDGIKLIGSCRQFYEDPNQLWGKTVALSFKTPSGITSQSATLPAVAPSSNRTLLSTSTDDSGVNAIVRYVNGKLAVVITASTETNIYWAKLEIGSVATEFSPPSIAEELPKCQRYYQIRSNSYTIETNAIDRPIPMRVNGTTGTTTIGGVTYKYVDAEL